MAFCSTGHPVRDGSAFCEVCGSPAMSQTRQAVSSPPGIEATCRSCGLSNPQRSPFCVRCGTSTQASPVWVSPTGTGGYASPGVGPLRGPSPLLSILMLVSTIATFVMMGFYGTITNLSSIQWDMNARFYQFWRFFVPFDNHLLVWRGRFLIIEFCVFFIFSIILISSRKIRSLHALWIILLVMSVITTIFNIVSLIPSDGYSSYIFATGITGPSIIELVLVLGLAVLSVAGLIQASRLRRGK